VRSHVLVTGAAIGVAALTAPAASAADHDPPVVPMFSAAYGAPQVDVIAGETVSWRHDSVRAHTVAAIDGSWASASVAPQASFSRRFDAPGAVPYYCSIHPGMRGEVDVHTLLLTAPRDPAASGRPYQLQGRAALPAGSTVSLTADDGTVAATATVEDGGDFRATVKPAATTSYRAVAGDQVSPPVTVLVLDRRVAAGAFARKRSVIVRTRVLPASPGVTVVLQLHLRERFGWWPVRRARLDSASRARFTLRRKRPVRARVVLVASDGATPLARSATIRLR
jgi:plastocyanin